MFCVKVREWFQVVCLTTGEHLNTSLAAAATATATATATAIATATYTGYCLGLAIEHIPSRDLIRVLSDCLIDYDKQKYFPPTIGHFNTSP
jgi:hypothetical protein